MKDEKDADSLLCRSPGKVKLTVCSILLFLIPEPREASIWSDMFSYRSNLYVTQNLWFKRDPIWFQSQNWKWQKYTSWFICSFLFVQILLRVDSIVHRFCVLFPKIEDYFSLLLFRCIRNEIPWERLSRLTENWEERGLSKWGPVTLFCICNSSLFASCPAV